MRIFLLDDAQPLRVLLGRIVADLGHEVVGEGAAIAASLPSVVTLGPDLIIFDGRLSGNDEVAGAFGPWGASDGAVFASLRAAVPDASLCIVAALRETALLRAAPGFGVRYALLRPYLRTRVAAVLSLIASDRAGASG